MTSCTLRRCSWSMRAGSQFGCQQRMTRRLSSKFPSTRLSSSYLQLFRSSTSVRSCFARIEALADISQGLGGCSLIAESQASRSTPLLQGRQPLRMELLPTSSTTSESGQVFIDHRILSGRPTDTLYSISKDSSHSLVLDFTFGACNACCLGIRGLHSAFASSRWILAFQAAVNARYSTP